MASIRWLPEIPPGVLGAPGVKTAEQEMLPRGAEQNSRFLFCPVTGCLQINYDLPNCGLSTFLKLASHDTKTERISRES